MPAQIQRKPGCMAAMAQMIDQHCGDGAYCKPPRRAVCSMTAETEQPIEGCGIELLACAKQVLQKKETTENKAGKYRRGNSEMKNERRSSKRRNDPDRVT